MHAAVNSSEKAAAGGAATNLVRLPAPSNAPSGGRPPAGERRRGAGRGARAAAAPAGAAARAPWPAGIGCMERADGRGRGIESQGRTVDAGSTPASQPPPLPHLPLSSSLPRRRVLRSSSRYLGRAALLNLTPERAGRPPRAAGSIGPAAVRHRLGWASFVCGRNIVWGFLARPRAKRVRVEGALRALAAWSAPLLHCAGPSSAATRAECRERAERATRRLLRRHSAMQRMDLQSSGNTPGRIPGR